MLTTIVVGLLGGLITGISPCILPVLPVVLAASGRQVRQASPEPVTVGAAAPPTPVAAAGANLRPYAVIAGLVVSFGLLTLVGSLVIGALGLPAGVLTTIGTVLLVAIGLGMIFPAIERLLERPFARLPQRAATGERGGFLLGLGLGLLFVPCAGPVLAAIVVAGATGAIGVDTVLLTLAFAVGVAIPLLGFALAGARVAERVGAFRRRQRWVRVGAGLVVIATALLNTTVFAPLQRALPDYTKPLADQIERSEVFKPVPSARGGQPRCVEGSETLQDCGPAPSLRGIAAWINAPDGGIDLAALRGKVVLVDFWTYTCINCQRTLPYVTAWDRAYRDAGLQVIGVHTPEFGFEKDLGNVGSAVAREKIEYPVALDNDYATWNNYRNRYWPAFYLIDAAGQIRYIKFGEGDYDRTESLIRELLAQRPGAGPLPGAATP